MSFWVKPNFRPELSGGIRSLFDFSRYHEGCASFKINKSPFGLWFLPGASSKPRSLLFAASVPTDDIIRQLDYGGTNFAFGRFADTVNTMDTPSETGIPSYFSANHWTYVSLMWELKDLVTGGQPTGARMFINGREVGSVLPGSNLGTGNGKYMLFYHDPLQLTKTNSTVTTTLADGSKVTIQKEETTVKGIHSNTMRLGNPSQIAASQGPYYGGNFPADATFDELFAWTEPSKGLAGSATLWKRGRYYAAGLNGDAWLSPALQLSTAAQRFLPPPTSIAAPVTTETVTAVNVTQPVQAEKVRIRGLSFTWYGEETVGVVKGTPSLKRVLWDYSTDYEPVSAKMAQGLTAFDSNAPRPKKAIDVLTEVTVLDGAQVVTRCTDDGYSEVDHEFDPSATKIRYGVRFITAGTSATTADAILLATPVFDDITIYWSNEKPAFLEYLQVR